MTLPSSGAISLSQVQTEFGGSNPISLSEYYRGGSLVPSGTAAGSTGVQIAASGAINMNNFHGTSDAVVALTNHSISDNHFTIAPTDASANSQFVLDADGIAYFNRLRASDGSYPGEWLLAGSASAYECRFTVTSGSFTSGTFGSWLALSSDRQIGNSASVTTMGTQVRNGTALVEIGLAGSGVALVSASVSCNATATCEP